MKLSKKLKILWDIGILSAVGIVLRYLYARLSGLPHILMVEPTDICDLKCSICYVQNIKMKREKHQISLEEFKKLIDSVKSHCIYVSLWFTGEPLLNKNIFKMIEYCTANNIITAMSTNAMQLNEEASELLVKSGLYSLTISSDGTTKESYEKIRIGGKWEKLLDNVKTMMATKEKMHSATPYVSMQMIVTKDNEHEVKDFKKLVDELKVDGALTKSLYLFAAAGNTEFKEALDKLKPSQEENRRKRSDYCMAHDRAVVQCDGKVVPCCFDVDSVYVFGDTNTSPFKDIWRKEEYKKFRADQKKFETSPLCSNCGCSTDYTIQKLR